MVKSMLSVEFTNTPKDTSHVLCSVTGVLNKEETFSVHQVCWLDNFGEENLLLSDEEGWT